MIKTSDLRSKSVIDLWDGKKLGTISDIEFDLDGGRITALIVPDSERFLGLFSRGSELIIPWEKIEKIGTDVILVNQLQYNNVESKK